jgi:hypothetical protein
MTGRSYNFQQHPIAPVGAKVLTWDSPSHRGTWADHGVEAVYLGPAENHLRAFEVWVPNTSAPRVTNTVWWFLHDGVKADMPLIDQDAHLAYPPSKARPQPRDNGSDLIGRAFLEPELGVCLITGLGPVVHNQMSTRARRRKNRAAGEPIIAEGSHFTLMYTQTTTGEENYSSLTEILNWIETGPLLQPPTPNDPTNQTEAPITTPSHVPATVQYVPNTAPPLSKPPPNAESAREKRVSFEPQKTSELSHRRKTKTSAKTVQIQKVNERGVQTVCDWTEKRVSLPRQAKRTTAYNVESQSHDEHPRQRTAGLFRGLTGNSVKTPDPLGQVSHAPTSQMSALFPGDAIGEPPPHPPGFIPIPYPIIPNESIDDETDRFARWCEDSERRYKRAHRASLSPLDCMDEEDMPPSSDQALTTTPSVVNDGSPPQLLRAMPRSVLRSVFPSGPLNLNPDGMDT